MQKCYRGFINSGSIGKKETPQKVQNLVIREYCKKNSLGTTLSFTEFNVGNGMVLKSLLDEGVTGILFYSFENFPSDKKLQELIWKKVRNENLEIHFCLEEFSIQSATQIKDFLDIQIYQQLSEKSLTNPFLTKRSEC